MHLDRLSNMLSVGLSVTAHKISSHFCVEGLNVVVLQLDFRYICEVQDGRLSPIILKLLWITLATCLPKTDFFSDGALPSALVTCFLMFPVGMFRSPLTILKSRFSKSGIGVPVTDTDVMRSSILLASSTSPIASQEYCEVRVTSLLKLICQLLKSVGSSHLSKTIASASLFLRSSIIIDGHFQQVMMSSEERNCVMPLEFSRWWRTRGCRQLWSCVRQSARESVCLCTTPVRIVSLRLSNQRMIKTNSTLSDLCRNKSP